MGQEVVKGLKQNKKEAKEKDSDDEDTTIVRVD